IKAQEVKVWPEVTGYLGHDVTLHCEFIQGPQVANITQVQWALLQPNGKENVIIVYNTILGPSIHKPYVEEKVGIEGLSLIIKDVNMTDAGLYRCSISAFPSGAFEGTTKLIVKDDCVSMFTESLNVQMGHI
uniref:Ig-like domain-containing protein n=1 Tax=Sphaeramia orbicularis TaxID=375764 RepID=A0A673CKX5_9TELE